MKQEEFMRKVGRIEEIGVQLRMIDLALEVASGVRGCGVNAPTLVCYGARFPIPHETAVRMMEEHRAALRSEASTLREELGIDPEEATANGRGG